MVNANYMELSGAFNFRDIGGYMSVEGKTVRRGVVFRADSLAYLTIQDRKTLKSKNIKRIIDLRDEREVVAAPDVFEDDDEITVIHIPLLEDYNSPPLHPETLTTEPVPDLSALYIRCVETCGARIRSVFELFSRPIDGATVVHCTAGKDRTGVIVALLLDLCGVNRNAILEDYAVSERLLEPNLDTLLGHLEQVIGRPEREEYLMSEKRSMERTLAHIDSVYGSSVRYLHTVGLSNSNAKSIRQLLLE